MLFHKKTKKKSYDKESFMPVLHCSICTGEQVAGFKDIHTGKFHEVALIKNELELQSFMEEYRIDSITREY